MSEHIRAVLKRKLEDLTTYGGLDSETRSNALKEELQFYVLDFIYHHPVYSAWVMYGGSALRIVHGLNRMSVDLDFEVAHEVTPGFLQGLKQEVENHFATTYDVNADFLAVKITNGRGLKLKFMVGDLLDGYPSGKVHVKIDLNHFSAPQTVTERRPIQRGQFSFVIRTYNMSALMASKIVAIFLRGTRGVGEAVYAEKGRDIYDLLWYMEKRVVPDLDYLIAKKIDVTDLRALFTKLTIQMNKVSNKNLSDDLTPLFVDRNFIRHWLENWLEQYFHYVEAYEIRTVRELKQILVFRDLFAGTYSFLFTYATEDRTVVNFTCAVADRWVFRDNESFAIVVSEEVRKLTEFNRNGASSQPNPTEVLLQFATLFHNKIEAYLTKAHRITLGNQIVTKLIRTTTENFDQREQIVLDLPTLLSCELDDLFR